MTSAPQPYFARTYREARAAFRAAASDHPHLALRGELSVVDDYTIDWAFTGDASAKDVLVYTSGLHGIEGYAGSAVQRRLLALGERDPVLWVHALNPWGMDHYRRVNERNVDLNRNFLPEGASYASDDAAYAELDPILNPKRPPRRDLFLLWAGVTVARRGMGALRNVVARGQYSFPQGIFYGGSEAEATTKRVLELLPARLAGKRRIVHIDLHTARGPRGEYVAFLEKGDGTESARAKPIFGQSLRAWEPDSEDGYEMRGGMLPELQRRVPGARYDAITLEFGTATDLTIVRALRAENQAHFHGAWPGGKRARRAMRAAFFPEDTAWQQRVVEHATSIHRQALRLLASAA